MWNRFHLSNAIYKTFACAPRSTRFPAALNKTAKIASFSTLPKSNLPAADMSATSEASTPQSSQVKPDSEAAKSAPEELPPLSDHDFRIYNHLAEKMEYFHNNFRRSWTLLWTACTTGRRPQNMSLRQFIAQGLQFAEHLTAHHGIEETYVFPHLARKMPEFRGGKGGGAAAELLRQHRQIHAGLDGFEAYLRACRAGEVDFSLDALREKMESWGDVLWTHLDQEVKTLGAENMRRYWTKEEVLRLPM